MNERLKIVSVEPDGLQEALNAAAEKLPADTAVMVLTYHPASGLAGYVANVDRPGALRFISEWVERQRRMQG